MVSMKNYNQGNNEGIVYTEYIDNLSKYGYKRGIVQSMFDDGINFKVVNKIENDIAEEDLIENDMED